MDNDDPSTSRARSTKTEPAPALSEAELSKIARQAVRQPADPRLDSELARMGLGATEAHDPLPGQSRARPVMTGQELERLGRQLRRLERVVWVLGVAIAILAVIVVFVLVR
jgi:hypothetical protein